MLNNQLVRLLDSNQIEQCYGTIYNRNKKCTTAAPTAAPTAAVPDCGLPQDADTYPVFQMNSAISAIGYRAADPIEGNGIQYHLVPSNPSSCPITSFLNINGSDAKLYENPEGCDGYVYATLFQNLKCGTTKRYKFEYQKDGDYTLRVSDKGQYTIAQYQSN